MATPTDRLGRPLHDLRISVTDRCNLRCTYCMPAAIFGERYRFLPRRALLTFEEIERLARLFVELGVRKLRLTGGEPLVRAELPELVRRLARIPNVEDLALTTNGVLLGGNAGALREAGLRRVTISLDSHDDTVFGSINGRGVGTASVFAGIKAAERAGLRPIKLNCVVQRGANEGSVVGLACRFRGTGHVVRFIEFMDVGTRNAWDLSRVVPAREILERIDTIFPLEPVAPRGPGEVARRYRYRDGGGEIGVIASVTEPFCGDCTRARLTANGQLLTCLFASSGTDLKGPLRLGASDAELRQRIRSVWTGRGDRYSEARAEPEPDTRPSVRPKLEMHQVGG